MRERQNVENLPRKGEQGERKTTVHDGIVLMRSVKTNRRDFGF
jgi:hypothetical protein